MLLISKRLRLIYRVYTVKENCEYCDAKQFKNYSINNIRNCQLIL